jgi:hypothetical protein
VEAIALHHQPSLSGSKAFGPLTAVHVANVLSHAHPGASDGIAVAQMEAEYLAGLGLDQRLPAWSAAARETLVAAA